MNRRELLTLLGAAGAAWPVAAWGQQSRPICRIGYLHPGSGALGKILLGFMDGMRSLGWVEGRDFIFNPRFAEDRPERLESLAADLVNSNVILTGGTLAPLAARRATQSTPIVMGAAGDPLGSGLVATLARPGSNVTGLSLMSPELGGKRLELLKDLLPSFSRAAIVWNAASPYPKALFQNTQDAARTVAIELHSLPVRNPGDFEPAFDAVARLRPQALIVVEDPLTSGQMKEIVEFAARARLPALSGFREFAALGGLMSYGADIVDLYRRAAGYVDKICKGASPADLPVEQPNKFELVINLKTARALGITVPATLLARADEVLE
jgi:putative ABC transport system substrate-binding protein